MEGCGGGGVCGVIGSEGRVMVTVMWYDGVMVTGVWCNGV